MKNAPVLLLIPAVLCSCTSIEKRQEHARIEALRRDPHWPIIRATAEIEIARYEGNTDWSRSAYYTPQHHTNGVWVVSAWGAYPANTLGDSIELLSSDNGEVFWYSPRMPFRAR